MKKILIASTSTTYGSSYLEYLLVELSDFFKSVDCILFVPYARPSGMSHDTYTRIAQNAFQKIGKKVMGLHKFKDPKKAVADAQGVFVGGGNSFVLLNALYKLDLMQPLKAAILSGTPYLGTSAGSNICGQTIGTSNDMPIVYPPSFKALELIPFNINPHYLEPLKDSRHMGESRATRIKEFHFFNNHNVLGLREGSYLKIHGDKIKLKGPFKACVFKKDSLPYEIEPGTDLSRFK